MDNDQTLQSSVKASELGENLMETTSTSWNNNGNTREQKADIY